MSIKCHVYVDLVDKSLCDRWINRVIFHSTDSQSANRFGSRYTLSLAISGEKVDTRVRGTIHCVVTARRAKSGGVVTGPCRGPHTGTYPKISRKAILNKERPTVIDEWQIRNH